MGRKAKTRFVASVNGIPRILLSINESNDGGLTLISDSSSYFSIAMGAPTKVSEQHYSVHRSKSGLDTTVTQKTTLESRDLHSNVSYLHDTSNKLLWPILARRVPRISTPSSHNIRSRDTIIEIASYTQEKSSLLYSVFVSDLKFDPDMMLGALNKYFVARFSRTQLIVIPMFINMPSLDPGDVVVYSTSSSVVNDVKAEDHMQIRRGSMEYGELLKTHMDLMGILANAMKARLEKLFGRSLTEEEAGMSSFLTLDPLIR